jgi:hypothetical protein
MQGFRRRLLFALPVIVTGVLSCRGAPIVRTPPIPPGITLPGLRAAVLPVLRPEGEFDPSAGESNVQVDDAGSYTGSIHPHRQANRDTLFHGKVLARLIVSGPGLIGYRNFRPRVWYQWVVVNVNGQLHSLYVPEDGGAEVFGFLTMNLDSISHPGPRARWKRDSDGVPWSGCTEWGCCCGDYKCDSRHQ